jgi:hypothetical protein
MLQQQRVHELEAGHGTNSKQVVLYQGGAQRLLDGRVHAGMLLVGHAGNASEQASNASKQREQRKQRKQDGRFWM